MAFNDAEISNQDGRIVGLYRLQWGNTIWRYTSADRDIPLNENGEDVIYEAVAISDNGMVQGGSTGNDFTITLPSNLPVVQLFRGTPPSANIFIRVRRKHVQEADAPVFWVGTVGNIKRVDDASAQIIGRTLTSSFKRSGLRLSWQKNCPHILYDHGCTVDPDDHEVEGVVTALTATTVTVSGPAVALGAEWFNGGFCKWVADPNGTFERRGIESTVTPGTFSLYGRTDRLAVGDTLLLYPGCPHTPTACQAKFANLPNYGGYDFIPGKSPFDGTPVF